MSQRLFERAALLCGAAMTLVPAAAYAQQDERPATATQDDVRGDIVVTATRRNEAMKDVAMSVNVATGEQIEKLNIFDAKDMQQLAPGLELTNTTGRNNTTTLRGLTFDPDQGTSPAVQVYYNEVPTDAQTVYTAIYDIEQIEVLRGPQGLLRGLSAPAGAITIATRKPSFDQIEGYAQATATTRGGYNVQGGISLPFSDAVSLRVAAVADGNRLNHVRNLNLDKRSRSRTQSVRATLGLRPSDAFKAYLSYQYLTADNVQFPQVIGTGNTPAYQLLPFLGGIVLPDTTERSGPPLVASDYASVSEGIFRNQNDTHIVNLQIEYDFGPATLSFAGAHQYSKLNILRDWDEGNAVPNYVDTSRVVTPYKVDTAELRLASNNDEGLGWGVGAFYTKTTGTTRVNEHADSFFFPASVVTTPLVLGDAPYLPIATDVSVPVNIRTLSFNANLRYKSGPLKIEGGIRYSIIKNIQTATIGISSPGNLFAGVAPFSLVQDGIPAELSRTKEKPWTGGINITYEITPDVNIYAAYGHSFRAGSAGVATPLGISADLVKTRPEKTDSWEAGLKGSILDHRANFSIAGFYQKIDGYLSRFNRIFYNCSELFGSCYPSPPAPPINNAVDIPNGAFEFNYNGDATVKGIEASLDGGISRNWDLGVSASYVRARYDNALLPCNDFAGTGIPNRTGAPRVTGTGNVSYCLSNGRIAEVPDFNLTANTEIRAPMGNVTPYLRGLFTYRPGFHSERVAYDYRSRALLNLFAGVRSQDSRWDVNLFARNLLNQKRITDIRGGNEVRATAAGLAYDSGYRIVNVMAPREFGLTAAFKF